MKVIVSKIPSRCEDCLFLKPIFNDDYGDDCMLLKLKIPLSISHTTRFESCPLKAECLCGDYATVRETFESEGYTFIKGCEYPVTQDEYYIGLEDDNGKLHYIEYGEAERYLMTPN